MTLPGPAPAGGFLFCLAKKGIKKGDPMPGSPSPCDGEPRGDHVSRGADIRGFKVKNQVKNRTRVGTMDVARVGTMSVA